MSNEIKFGPLGTSVFSFFLSFFYFTDRINKPPYYAPQVITAIRTGSRVQVLTNSVNSTLTSTIAFLSHMFTVLGYGLN